MENNNTSPRSHESMSLYKWMALVLFAASLVKLVPYWFFIIPLAVDWGFDLVVFVFGPAYKEYRLLQKERRKHKELLNAFSSSIDSIVEAKAKSRDFVNLKALRNEAIYRAGWEANIAVAFQDAAEKAEWPQTGDGMITLTKTEIHRVSNIAAKNFMDNLLSNSDKYTRNDSPLDKEPKKFPAGGVRTDNEPEYASMISGRRYGKKDASEKNIKSDIINLVTIKHPTVRRQLTLKAKIEEYFASEIIPNTDFYKMLRKCVIPPGYMYNLTGTSVDEAGKCPVIKKRGDKLLNADMEFLYRKGDLDFDINKADEERTLEIIASMIDPEHEYELPGSKDTCLGLLLSRHELITLFFETNQIQERYQQKQREKTVNKAPGGILVTPDQRDEQDLNSAKKLLIGSHIYDLAGCTGANLKSKNGYFLTDKEILWLFRETTQLSTAKGAEIGKAKDQSEKMNQTTPETESDLNAAWELILPNKVYELQDGSKKIGHLLMHSEALYLYRDTDQLSNRLDRELPAPGHEPKQEAESPEENPGEKAPEFDHLPPEFIQPCQIVSEDLPVMFSHETLKQYLDGRSEKGLARFIKCALVRKEIGYAVIGYQGKKSIQKVFGRQLSDGMIVHLYKNGKFDAAIEQWEQRRAEKNNIEKDKTKNKIVVTARTELLSMATQVIEPKKEYDLDGFFRDTVSESEYYALKEMGNGFMIRGSRLTNTQILWLATNGVIEVPF